MEAYFSELSQTIFSRLKGDEVLLTNYRGEDSQFCRFNNSRVRQAGNVCQHSLQLDLIDGHKQAHAAFDLSGDLSTDVKLANDFVESLRGQLGFLPQDPFIHYETQGESSSVVSDSASPNVDEMLTNIIEQSQGIDLVGILAAGQMSQGFASSLGQTNWQSDSSFNFDWSVYQHGDKAIKQNYAGSLWRSEELTKKLAFAKETLPLLGKPSKTIQPGQYRAYLTPSALQEIFELLHWGGFGLKSHKTAQTPLLRMVKEGLTLDERVSITENHAEGLVPRFSRRGFRLPEKVELIRGGVYSECLANPRSAMEYEAKVNCDIEHPCSLDMAGGDLSDEAIMQTLDTGVYISNLWYCNYSDRNHCRITGMTRFACLWVENGEPVAPLGVMRFDESVLDMLGPKLESLTLRREHILDPSSYEHRSHNSARLPGVLVRDFTFTL